MRCRDCSRRAQTALYADGIRAEGDTMKRQGLYEPTIEDTVELSGIEVLHPGGDAMTRRTAEVAGLTTGMQILDVSSGRGTQSLFYAKHFGARVTGLDLAPEMVLSAQERAEDAGLTDQVDFVRGDSQVLPFAEAHFDAVINECAVGIPDDPQRVLDEMARVVRPGGMVVIHESTWAVKLSTDEKTELTERYGTTPMERNEWLDMMETAGLVEVESESEPWSRPENFWKIRQNRDVSHSRWVLTPWERLVTLLRIVRAHGLAGVFTAFANERAFYRAIRDGKIGYGLYWGRKPSVTAG